MVLYHLDEDIWSNDTLLIRPEAEKWWNDRCGDKISNLGLHSGFQPETIGIATSNERLEFGSRFDSRRHCGALA